MDSFNVPGSRYYCPVNHRLSAMQNKKPTIKDIAAKAKVSKSTVSRVLNNSRFVNDKKRRAVLAAIDKLEFKPNQLARSLAGGKSLAIGVVTHEIGSPFYDLVAEGVTDGLRKTAYSPIFIDGRWDAVTEEAAIHTLLDRRVDGIILIGGNVTVKKIDKIKVQTPIVVVAREIPEWTTGNYYVDNFQGAFDATQYLIDLGHRDIAFIAGIMTHQDAIGRKSGFIAALKDSGIKFKEELFIEGDFRAPSGVLAAESLLARNVRFSAIFSSNDEMAFGARLLLYRRGIRVPEDVSILGFDDQPNSAFMTPPLTTVKQPAFELGLAGATAMVRLLENAEFEAPPFETKLVVRESVLRR